MSYKKVVVAAVCLIIGMTSLVACKRKTEDQLSSETVPQAQASKAAAVSVLSPSGYGKIHFGMTLAEAKAAAGPLEGADPPTAGDGFECSYVRFKALPEVMFMSTRGILVRADAAAENFLPNSAEVTLNMPVADVKQRYPGIQIDPNKYDDTAQDLFLTSPDGKAGLLFEATNGKIRQVRAGRFEEVQFSERCG